MNINSIRDKKLELLAFLDFHQPHVVAIQETKIDSSIATSELFPETCPYSVYRKDEISMVAGSCCSSIRTFRICLSQNWKTTRNQFGWKCLQTKLLILWQVGIDRLVALAKNSNYLENSLITLGLIIRVKSYPQLMSWGDFNFKNIDWPDRLSKSGSTLSQS